MAWWGGAFIALLASFLLLDLRLHAPAPPEVLELEFVVPAAPEARREPLVVTGHRGAGDLFYVWYRDASSVVFGYDSWGRGGPLSPPVPAKAGQRLRLRVVLPSIAQLATGVRAKELQVAVEGGPAWRAEVSSHACQAGSVQWAANRIGGTSCAEVFSGELRRAGRHPLDGLGAGRYLTTGERLEVWLHGRLPFGLLYMGASLLFSWVLVLLVPWPALLRRARAFASPEGLTPMPTVAGGPHRDEAGGREPCAWLAGLPARAFLFGVVAGFGLCVAAGYRVGERALFRDFLRFFYPLQPQTLFYPTARNLVAQVEAMAPKDKVLVLVGGASYFRGTGQNPGELWTLELQRLLGDRYAVVNLAIDQAGPPAFAGVAYQMLARRYPRMVYVCSGGVFIGDPLDGGDVYRYLYWDAHYKGLLESDPVWRMRVERERERQLRTFEGRELHLGKRLESLTFASDLWNWVGYNVAFTVWSDQYPLHPFRARGRYREGDDILIGQRQLDARKDPAVVRLLEERNREGSKNGYVRGADGRWTLDPLTAGMIADSYARMFPEGVRSRCLVALMHANPYFMKTLDDDDRRRLREVHALAQEVLEGLGFPVVHAGAGFDADDFADGGHFMPSGGRKVARIIADKVRTLEP